VGVELNRFFIHDTRDSSPEGNQPDSSPTIIAVSTTTAQRILAFAAVLAFCVVAVVLLLADRSGSLVGSAESLIVDTGQTTERALQIDVLDRSDIPGSVEQFGHALLWGTGMLLFGWILRARLPLLLTALFVAGASVIVETAQPVLSATRRFESSDAMANFFGIGVAVVFLAVAIWVENRRTSRTWKHLVASLRR